MTSAAGFRESLIQRPIVPIEAQEAIVEHAEKFAEKSNKEVVADLKKITKVEEPLKEQRRIVI